MKRFIFQEARPLQPDHRWKAQPGCRIFVADRGALRLDFPQDWVWSRDEDSFKFRDREPPDDRCTLAVSLWHVDGLPREIPVASLVVATLESDGRKPIAKGQVQEERRGGLDLAWAEMRFIEPNERREALSRWCVAREGRLLAILSLDFWPEDASWVDPPWRHVLASLELDRPIADPTVGPLVH